MKTLKKAISMFLVATTVLAMMCVGTVSAGAVRQKIVIRGTATYMADIGGEETVFKLYDTDEDMPSEGYIKRLENDGGWTDAVWDCYYLNLEEGDTISYSLSYQFDSSSIENLNTVFLNIGFENSTKTSDGGYIHSDEKNKEFACYWCKSSGTAAIIGKKVDYEITITPKATKRLSAPTNVKATADSNQIKLTWTAVSGATKYRIQRLNDSKWGTIATVSTNSYTNTGLTNGTKYSYRVLASGDGLTWSSASATVSATPKVSAPTNVKATAGNKQVKLTWTAVSGAAKYRVQRLNGSTWTTIATVSTNSYTNTGLTNGTKYYYRVLASADGTTWSGSSVIIQVAPSQALISAPTNVSATAGDKQIKLTWYGVSSVARYRVQRLNGSTWTTIAVVSATNYTDTGLAVGTKYSYRVLAGVDGSAWSGASAVVSATTRVATPTNLKATSGDKQVKLTWAAVSGATKYRVQRLDGLIWRTVGIVSTNGCTNTDLTNGTAYSYRVLASADGLTWSGTSAVVSATPMA